MAEYTKEQLWELYSQLPEDLQKAVFSEEIGKTVHRICQENNVLDEKTATLVLKNVGYVFLGLLTLEEFKTSLKKELKIKNGQALNIFGKVNQEVFSTVKESLEALYGIKIETPPEKPEKPKTPDQYREPIE